MTPLQFDSLVRRTQADEAIADYVNKTLMPEMADLKDQVDKLRHKLKRFREDRGNVVEGDNDLDV